MSAQKAGRQAGLVKVSQGQPKLAKASQLHTCRGRITGNEVTTSNKKLPFR